MLKEILFVLAIVYACSCDCIKNPVNDNQSPKATISVVYRESGKEVIKNYSSTMSQPESLMGFTVFVPGSTDYSLLLTANDGGCIRKLNLEKKEFRNTSDMQNISGLINLVNKDYSSCAKKSRIATYKIAKHDSKRIWYNLTAKDFAGTQKGVSLIVVPLPASNNNNTDNDSSSCVHSGRIGVWLTWNQVVLAPRWKGTIKSHLISQYCNGLKIKKVFFTIGSSNCDGVKSAGWHIKIGSQHYNFTAAQIANNNTDTDSYTDSITCSMNLSQALTTGLSIEVWGNFAILDYTQGGTCDTSEVPNIILYMDIGK